MRGVCRQHTKSSCWRAIFQKLTAPHEQCRRRGVQSEAGAAKWPHGAPAESVTAAWTVPVPPHPKPWRQAAIGGPLRCSRGARRQPPATAACWAGGTPPTHVRSTFACLLAGLLVLAAEDAAQGAGALGAALAGRLQKRQGRLGVGALAGAGKRAGGPSSRLRRTPAREVAVSVGCCCRHPGTCSRPTAPPSRPALRPRRWARSMRRHPAPAASQPCLLPGSCPTLTRLVPAAFLPPRRAPDFRMVS
jgi:hypothetical protein